MPLRMKAKNFLRNLFRFHRSDPDLDQEVQSHLALLIDENLRAGMPLEEAQRAARIELGGIEQVKEQVREQRIGNWLHSVLSDCRYGIHTLRKDFGFTTIVVLTLAVGIGATTAIFSVMDASILRGLPYRNPSQLVEIGENNSQGESDSVSAADLTELQNAAHSFEELAYTGEWKFYALTGAGEPDEAWGWQVSTNLFQVLGVHAVLGRTFLPAEDRSVILSNRYWRTHFSANPDVIGRTLVLNGNSVTIVGVMPADFYFFMRATDLWVPLLLSPQEATVSDKRSLSVIGRLKPGFSLQQARTEMRGIQSRLAVAFPKDDVGLTITAKLMNDSAFSDFQTIVLVLFGAVLFTLLIACVNVANMFLARGATRQREVALRAALGAGKWRLVRQALTESLLVSGFSALLGLAIAMAALRFVVHLIPSSAANGMSGLQEITLNLPILSFTLGLSLLTGLAVGVSPALHGSRLDLNTSLKEGAATTSSFARRFRLQGLFVILEIGLALILLVGAGLMMESLHRLANVHLGFDPSHVLTIRVPLVANKYAEGPGSSAFYTEVLQRIRSVHGVRSAAMVNNLPLSAFEILGYFTLPGESAGDPPQNIRVGLQAVSRAYFLAMGIPLLRGRDFTAEDERAGAEKVVIVSESMARLYRSNETMVGARLGDVTVIGIVADTRRHSLGEEPSPLAYVPYGRRPFASFLMTFVVRADANPRALVPDVRSAIRGLDQDQPIIQIRTMDDIVAESIWQTNFSTTLLTTLAAVALFLAAVGIYGVTTYSVSQRTHEIGVRVAVGAQRQDILGLVIGRGIVWAVIGTALGVGGSLVMTRFLANMLYGVKPTDPLIFLAVATLLVSLALLACYLPARRAASVDPMVALRHE